MDILPPEIWLSIIQFAGASDPDGHLHAFINIALISKQFHHVVFCSENDSAVWKPAAISLGIHPGIHIDDVLFAGASSLENRSWRKVYKFMKEWQKPFPQDATIPKAKRVAWNLPSLKGAGDGFVRRTFEMACCGTGRGLSYQVKQPVAADKGNVIFEARNIDNDKTAVAAGLLEAGEERARQASGRSRRVEKHILFPFPLSAGYMVTEEKSGFVVSKIDPTTASASMSWLFGERRPDRFTSFKNIMVAITHHGPDDELSELPNAQNCRSILVCLKAGDPKPVWQLDVSVDWYHADDDYRGFAHVKNFHVTSTYLVALITRHPNAYMRKMTGTYFVVVNLLTGEIVKELKIHKKAVSPGEPAPPALPDPALMGANGPLQYNARASYTTAFSHDFILTDSVIVSGGPAGEILVWCFFGENASDTPIAVIPTDRFNGHQLRFTDLQLSTCGTYLALTSSKQMYIYDMIAKKPIEVYDNGRTVSDANRYSSNPLDDFPSGVWVRWTDWTMVSADDKQPLPTFTAVNEHGKYWKRIGEGVVYLSEAGIEFSYDNPLRALTVPKRLPRWVSNLRRAVHNNSSWILFTLIGLLLAALYSVLGVGKVYLAGYLGRMLERIYNDSRSG
ncbi:hypothetical protein H072_4511 [Dactylellina haptotyla CBS 200.50]|uniref:Uncharacterized protein n=1 Tax=Dactylellina haptotyla (strain CBS 200.50) TaxID=1284197 RepID=S8BQ50_DACHA|nr:hypothetical protein H072_4511 [Dactylellina haptotyla CBS 200.50]